MKKIRSKFWAIALCVIAAIQIAVVSCSDDPGVDSYYTSSRKYAADYLKGDAKFSEYIKILERATGEYDLRLVDMLGTYGHYTVFAPTNDAVEKYLMGRGLSSVDELSKEDCDTIALNSIIEMAYFTTDISDGEYPKSNMLEHVVSVEAVQEWDEASQDSVVSLYINQNARMIHADDSVANGVVHTMSDIVNASHELIGTIIMNNPACSRYAEALTVTGIMDLIQQNYIDDTYGWATDQDRIDSCTWTNNKLCIPTAKYADGSGGEYDNVAYPVKRYFNYTVFICPDSILEDRYGITTLEDLEAKAHEIYDPFYPEDANVTDRKDPRNALYKFIAYHVLDRWGSYWGLTCYDGDASQYKLSHNFNREAYDICDWYPTLLPHSIMKFSYPYGSRAGSGNRSGGLWINRRGVMNGPDSRGGWAPGVRVARPNEHKMRQQGINGIYHYVDGILAYDETMRNIVCDDCIRVDGTTLSPDFMTKMTDGEVARGHSQDGQVYGTSYNTSTASANKNRSIGFKPGYARNFTLSAQTHMHVRARTLNFWSYEADEMIFKGRYDFTIKLPPVPQGTYEVRMMTCVGFDTRGIVQYYLGSDPDHMIPQGIPFDMRGNGESLFGFKDDKSFNNDQDAIQAFDNAIHNIQWMKGPNCYASGVRDEWSNDATTFRNQNNTIRRVIGTFTTDGKTDQYLRIQQKMESDNNELNLDFLEICPRSVYNNEYYPEPIL